MMPVTRRAHDASEARALEAMWVTRAEFANQMFLDGDIKGFDLFVPAWVRECDGFIFLLDHPRAAARAAIWLYCPEVIQS